MPPSLLEFPGPLKPELFCSRYEGGAYTRCLQSYLVVAPPERASPEMLIRSLGIHIIALASYGHLLSLQGGTTLQSPYRYFSMVFVFLFPQLPGVQILFRTVRMSARAIHTRRVSIGYFLAACSGCHVMRGGLMIPIDDIERERVQSRSRKYNIIWTGRLVLLLALSTQFVGSLTLCLRAIRFRLGGVGNDLDLQNGQVIFGGLCATLNSVCITLLNRDWDTIPSVSEDIEMSHDSSESIDISAETSTVNESQTTFPSHRINDAILPNPDVKQQTSYQHNNLELMRRLNTSFSAKLSRFYPKSVQLDADRAFLAFHAFFLATFPYGWQPPDWNRPMIWTDFSSGEEEPVYRDPPQLDFGCVFTPWNKAEPLSHINWISVISALYYMQVFRIIINNLSAGLSGCGVGRHLSPRCRELAADLNRWIFGGRSIFSFPLNFVMLLPVLLRYVEVGFDMAIIREHEVRYPLTDRFTRTLIWKYFWKDPWQENMYVL